MSTGGKAPRIQLAKKRNEVAVSDEKEPEEGDFVEEEQVEASWDPQSYTPRLAIILSLHTLSTDLV